MSPSLVVDSHPVHAAHKRRVNELIGESLADYPPDERIAFFCECESERCFEAVWLTLDEYENRHANRRRWVIRSGHRRPPAASDARSEAQAVPA